MVRNHSFLETLIKKENGQIIPDIYHKPTDTHNTPISIITTLK